MARRDWRARIAAGGRNDDREQYGLGGRQWWTCVQTQSVIAVRIRQRAAEMQE
jgi:hypothetical protein